MTVNKKSTIQLTAGAVAVVAELKQRDNTLVYTEHTFPNGSFDATLKNSEGQILNEPELFSMAQRAVNAAPDNVS